jgi:hypothetical protein
MTHRSTYAHRFNTRAAIRRPKPTLAQVRAGMSDEEFAAHLETLPSDLARSVASLQRSCARMAQAW